MLLYVLLGLALLFVIGYIVIHNSVMGTKNSLDNAESGIDVQLKKRLDLIPNLVATVKQYAAHESGLLEKITALRNNAMAASDPQQRFSAENQLGSALGQLRVTMENYPDLKANQNFLQLQGSLNDTEEQIAAARRAYNAAVTEYHNCMDMIPYSFVASSKGFTRKPFFEAPAEAKDAPDISKMFG